jgi:hypothetical protein
LQEARVGHPTRAFSMNTLKTITIAAACLTATLTAASAARAGEHGEIGIGRTLTNQLVAHIGFPQPILLPRSIFAGFSGYATALVGFANVDLDDPAENVYTISEMSSISATLTARDPGAALYNGLPLLNVGESMDFGSPFFDYHPIFSIPNLAATHGQVFTLHLVLHDSSGTYTDSDEFTVSMTPACPGDFDLSGDLSIQDIFEFLNAWFAGLLTANYNQNGGLEIQDIFDFLTGWFEGCP